MQIRVATPDDFSAIMTIARQLPQWFTAGGLASIERDLHFQKCLVGIDGGKLIAFLSYYAKEGKGYIGWMGVAPDSRRKGIGRQLLAEMKHDLAAKGITEVFVWTLGDSVEYPPYAETRAFYRGAGFQDFERISHPDNPECEEELVLRAKTQA